MRILLVEDNIDLSASLCDFLESQSSVVDCAYDGCAGLEIAKQKEFDILILDINLPSLNGIELCDKIRNTLKINTPIMMLTARADLKDKLACFEHGADDYLVKPFEMEELLARLKVIQKRKTRSDTSLTVGELEFNITQSSISRGGVAIHLNPSCKKILCVLMQRSPEVVSREALEYELWGDNPPDGNGLKTHIHSIRQEVDKPFPQGYIKTIRGSGYQITDK